MNRLRQACIAATLALGIGVHAQAPFGEIDRVAAFARLYGVVRYFYPSDAAAGLDWNRFAVHGVAQVRAARDGDALIATLQSLFKPMGPGVAIGRTLPAAPPAGAPDTSLIAWRYLGAAVVPSSGMSPYLAKRTNRSPVVASTIDGFVTVLQTLPAEPLRGKTIRLRGQLRGTFKGAFGSASMFLRVDRPEARTGFFDNMGDRPVQHSDWREYTLQGPVADDAITVTFGPMASGAIDADFDRLIVEVQQPGGGWLEVAIADGGFEAADPGGWKRAGSSKTAVVSRPAAGAPEGRQYLRLSSAPVSPSITTGELFDAPLAAGAHVDIELGAGLRARVPLTLSNTDAGVASAEGRDELLEAAVRLIDGK